MEEKIRTIIAHYGKANQEDIAIEEMSELIKELCKNKRGFDNRGEIVEEVADVYLMLKQICILYSISLEELNPLIEFKVDRQINRIEAENGRG